jgi:hypothetical protein
VERKADNQDGRERYLSRASGDADRQALGEVVESYCRGDRQADLQGTATRTLGLRVEQFDVRNGERRRNLRRPAGACLSRLSASTRAA